MAQPQKVASGAGDIGSSETYSQMVSVPIADVRVRGRMRPVRAERVAALAESIAALGLHTPITV